MKNKGGRPRKYKTEEELQTAIDRYFDGYDRKELPYTVTGLAVALGLDRKGLIEYGGRPEFSNTIKKAKAKVEEFLERRLLSAGCVTGVIFNLKNNFGWKDKNETNITGDIVINLTREKGDTI